MLLGIAIVGVAALVVLVTWLYSLSGGLSRAQDLLTKTRVDFSTAKMTTLIKLQELVELKNNHRDRLVELEEERKLQLQLAGGGVWKTQSGFVLRIRDMSTNHLNNTLRLFASKSDKEPFVSMQRELARRAEDAMWEKRTGRSAEQEKADVWKANADKAADRAIYDNEVAAIRRLAVRLLDGKKVFTMKERKEWSTRMADAILYFEGKR